jgi:hypothetical protein
MKKKCSKILMFILMIVSSIFFPSAYAADDDKKSYIIIFKQAELVESEAPLQTLIKNGADTSEIMSSGTDEAKQDIVDELNLDGEVIDIYDGINGILVNINLTEANRLSRIGEFPCRLLRTKNHHFAIAPFPRFSAFAKACFRYPFSSKRQKLIAIANAFGAPIRPRPDPTRDRNIGSK